MRARTALISIACVVGLALAGCSSSVAGSPQLAGGGGVTTGDNGQAGGDVTTSTPADDGSDSGPTTTDQDDSDSGHGGDSSLPPATDDDQSLPTGGLPTGGLPTDMTGIPGISDQCLAVANLSMTIGFLLIAPMMGSQPLTQEQVDQAFAQMGDIPPDLQQPMQVLHDAAVQAIGKPVAQAAEILGSDKVSQAMDTLSKYLDDACGGS
jgi:hypothetical protein